MRRYRTQPIDSLRSTAAAAEGPEPKSPEASALAPGAAPLLRSTVDSSSAAAQLDRNSAAAIGRGRLCTRGRHNIGRRRGDVYAVRIGIGVGIGRMGKGKGVVIRVRAIVIGIGGRRAERDPNADADPYTARLGRTRPKSRRRQSRRQDQNHSSFHRRILQVNSLSSLLFRTNRQRGLMVMSGGGSPQGQCAPIMLVSRIRHNRSGQLPSPNRTALSLRERVGVTGISRVVVPRILRFSLPLTPASPGGRGGGLRVPPGVRSPGVGVNCSERAAST